MTNIVRPSGVEWAVEANGLVKRFGATRALAGLSLWVPAGAIYGLLGPNGAGKSTVIRTLSTLVRPDAGFARVLGHDTVREARAVRARISLTGQFAAVDEDLTGRENLQVLARLRGYSYRRAARRADDLLASFDLAAAATRVVKTYSGGMRRRLDIAASVIVTPELLFLDEPTTGLDPQSRNEVWQIVRDLVCAGTTVVLTTQYLEEADRLAERVAVIDHGKVIAEGTTRELKASLGQRTLRLRLHNPAQRDAAQRALSVALDAPVQLESDPASLATLLPTERSGRDGTHHVRVALAQLADAGIDVSGIGLDQPSLEEVFLSLTTDSPSAGVSAS